MRGHLGSFSTEVSSTPIAFRAVASTNATTTTSFVIAKPTGTVDGDAMVAIVNANNSATITPPAGWTLINTVDPVTEATISTYYKKASSEGSDYTFTIGSSERTSGGIISFSGSFASNFIDVSSVNSATGGTDAPRASSVTTTVANTMLVYLSSYDNSDTAPVYTIAAGITQAVQTTGASKTIIGYKSQAAAGATGTINTTWDGSSSYYCGNHLIAIKQV